MRPRRIVAICSTPERSRSGPIRGSQDASSDRPRKTTFTVDLVAENSDLAEDVPVDEEARDVARGLAKTKAFEQSRRDRKKIESWSA
jgi:hypothetical protein